MVSIYSSKKYFLEDLLMGYLNIISISETTTVFYTNRSDLHDEIGLRLGLRMYNEEDIAILEKILHNLDKEIGFIIGAEYNEKEIEKMAKKLREKLMVIPELLF